MADLLIREMVAADDAEWFRMRCALWPEYSVDDLRAEMRDIATKPERTPVFVADRGGGRLGGFLEANVREYADGCRIGPVGYIEGWYVDADLRRQGIGRKLVKAAEAWARGKGLREMASDCVLENDVSLRAHRALGYVEVERLIHFQKALGDGDHRFLEELSAAPRPKFC